MKFKNYLENRCDTDPSFNKVVFEKELEWIVSNSYHFEELEGKNIEIIHAAPLELPLVTIKGFDNLKESVKIQSIFLEGDEVLVRCTKDSVNIKNDIDSEKLTKKLNPLQRLKEVFAHTSRDCSEDKMIAFMYGIISGWDEKSYRELKSMHNWSDEDIESIKMWHENYNEALEIYSKFLENKL